MRIAIMGTGGVGGFFGGLLARAGEDVIFIARGKHLQAIKKNGLQIRSPKGDFLIKVKATNNPAQVGPVELILFCVKDYDTEEAALQVKPMISKDTTVISLQNGVEKEEKLTRILGAEHIMGGLCALNAYIESPGVITHLGLERLAFGELDGSESSRGRRILDAFKNAGINANLSQNIIVEEWEKFVFICAVAGLCCITRLPLGPILQFQETKQLYINTMAEIIQIARKKGIDLGQNLIEKLLKFSNNLDPELKPSTLRDLENGKQIEIDTLNGAVVQYGQTLGVPTPTNEFIYACLKVVNKVNL